MHSKRQPLVLVPLEKGQGESAQHWEAVQPWVDLVRFWAVPLWSEVELAEGELVEPVAARPWKWMRLAQAE